MADVEQCDLRKPSCGRCLKENLHCEGYKRPTIFVSHQPEADDPSRLVIVRPKPAEWRSPTPWDRLPSVSILRSLSGAAFEDRVVQNYFEVLLPKGKYIPRSGVYSLGCYAWIDACVSLSPSSPVLRQALCAVSLSSIASQSGDQALIRKGAEFYGTALSRLNGALQNPQAAANDESVIPTCALLATYEVLEPVAFAFGGVAKTSFAAIQWLRLNAKGAAGPKLGCAHHGDSQAPPASWTAKAYNWACA